MNSLFENIPDIMKAASNNPLGVFALLIVIIAVISFFFFRKTSVRVRMAIFGLIFVGTVIFGISLFLNPYRKGDDQYASLLTAPEQKYPAHRDVIKFPPDNHFFIFRWSPVEGASDYTVEVDCLGCKESPHNWYSISGTPWHIRRNLGLRAPMGYDPIYSSKVHIRFRDSGGKALRWRVWAMNSEGRAGQKGEWCQFSFYGSF